MPLPDIEIGVNGYCTMAHVEAVNPLRDFTATSKPTRTQAAGVIEDYFHSINGVLTVLGYKIPVASGYATAIRQLRHLNALAAAAQVEESAFSAGNKEGSTHGSRLRQRYVKEWKAFREGKAALIGAPRDANYIPRDNERHAASAFDVGDDGAEKDPTFTLLAEF